MLLLAMLHNLRPYDHYNWLKVVDDGKWKLITALPQKYSPNRTTYCNLRFAHSMMSRSSCRVGMGGIWELLDRKTWEWDLSFKWEWDGNGNEVIEMGGNWYEKICSGTPLHQSGRCSTVDTTTFDDQQLQSSLRTWTDKGHCPAIR